MLKFVKPKPCKLLIAFAQRIFPRVLALDEKLPSLQTCDFALDLSDLSDLYIKEGKLDEAERLLVKASNIVETLDSTSHQAQATIQLNLAKVCLAKSKQEEADEHLQHALSLCDRSRGCKSSTYGEILLTFAKLATLRGQFETANDLIANSMEELALATGGSNGTFAKYLVMAAEIATQEGMNDYAKLLNAKAHSIHAHVNLIDH